MRILGLQLESGLDLFLGFLEFAFLVQLIGLQVIIVSLVRINPERFANRLVKGSLVAGLIIDRDADILAQMMLGIPS